MNNYTKGGMEPMREIKFRAWNKGANGFIYFGIFDGTVINSDWQVQQYIGHKDKNGKESYYDDLVKWGKAIYKVVWNEEEGIAALQYVSGREVFKYLRIKQIRQGEVIGNIYENEGLLNGREQ